MQLTKSEACLLKWTPDWVHVYISYQTWGYSINCYVSLPDCIKFSAPNFNPSSFQPGFTHPGPEAKANHPPTSSQPHQTVRLNVVNVTFGGDQVTVSSDQAAEATTWEVDGGCNRSLPGLVVTQRFFISNRENWGRWTHFGLIIFQRGWFNHQLATYWFV